MGSDQKAIVPNSLANAMVPGLFEAVSRPSVRLGKNLKAIWGYAPEGTKRRYEAHFVNKLTDCDGESSETDSSLEDHSSYAFRWICDYAARSAGARLAYYRLEILWQGRGQREPIAAMTVSC
jgi:hypothetical protein